MIGSKLRRPNLITSLIIFVLLTASFGLGFSQGAPDVTPGNASAKPNGNGWQCDEGYRDEGNAYLADAPRKHLTRSMCCEEASGKVPDAAHLEQEIARLKAQVMALSLRNAVLRSQHDDDR